MVTLGTATPPDIFFPITVLFVVLDVSILGFLEAGVHTVESLRVDFLQIWLA